MQILGLSDQVVSFIQSPVVREKYAGVDLIASCGDLPAEYLEYVVSMLNKTLVYVPGNHDSDDFDVQGGTGMDGRLSQVAGIWIAGLGGSRRYKPVGRHQYTEFQMGWRMIRWLPRLALRRMLYGYGLDLFLAHSPPRHMHDGEDWAHRGFSVFRTFLRIVHPRLMLHGHVSVHPNLDIVETEFQGCRVINIFPQRQVELELESNA
jgi:Icc-related predicted phosphoesterase